MKEPWINTYEAYPTGWPAQRLSELALNQSAGIKKDFSVNGENDVLCCSMSMPSYQPKDLQVPLNVLNI